MQDAEIEDGAAEDCADLPETMRDLRACMVCLLVKNYSQACPLFPRF